ncbi:hypothetical protein [Roseiconus lacunae]|uniref:Nitroreductase domain-containing protein n=1 Tax=Roseiconus lacunae TaxID=2605694 RepID=A0ABT7PPR6_9BACT|nr:hypothetical protein [Roseiconus lacunae]MDM4018338.1 hypothetical protein [Roseiconus lacunae]
MIQAAILAPSPDNNQPWKFRSNSETLDVLIDPDRSLPSDEASMFDLTAIGAAIENAVLAAAEVGYEAKLVSHDLDESTLNGAAPIVSISASPGGLPDPLYAAIENRCTCRKPYSPEPLEQGALLSLNSSTKSIPTVKIDWLTSKADKKRFGSLIATTDSLRFRTEAFHAELFKQLRFKKSKVYETRDGLDVQTLELPPGVATMLRMLKSWKLMRLIHAARLTPLLTAPSKAAVQQSGAIAVISVPDRTTESFLAGGRAIQRFWLAATNAGMSMHPLGSLPIFLLQSSPNPAFATSIKHAKEETASLLPGIGNRVIQLAFRVGHSPPPSHRSIRRDAVAVTADH